MNNTHKVNDDDLLQQLNDLILSCNESASISMNLTAISNGIDPLPSRDFGVGGLVEVSHNLYNNFSYSRPMIEFLKDSTSKTKKSNLYDF